MFELRPQLARVSIVRANVLAIMIPKNIEQEHVIQVIGEIKRSGVRNHFESVRYNRISI